MIDVRFDVINVVVDEMGDVGGCNLIRAIAAPVAQRSE
jgi:hypothetical protein